MIRKTLKLLLVFAFGFSSLCSDAAESLCAKNEKAFFSCMTKKRKLASVCGSSDLSKTGGYLVYRFGTSEKVELEFPKSKEGSAAKFLFSEYTRSMLSIRHLRFVNDGTKYSIDYSYDGEDKTTSPIKHEISVTPKGSNSAILLVCKEAVIDELYKLEEFTPCDPESFSGCPRK